MRCSGSGCHAGCFRRRLAAHHAASAPASAVAELGFVRRRYPSPVKKAFSLLLFLAAQFGTFAADPAPKVAEKIFTILSDASRKRFEATIKADRDFRNAVSKTFAFADRVEVFLLDHSIGKDAAYQPKDGEQTFPIRPYDKETKILKTRKAPAKDIPKWCAAVTKLITSDKDAGGALCHYPIHGIRIYAHDELLFETSICWHCRNYYFNYDGQSGWEGLNEDAKDLRTLLDEFMPVPEEEMKRFPGYKPKSK